MTLLRVIKDSILPLAAVISACTAVWMFGGHQICFFKGLIGIPCPGCGITHAWMSFFSGNLREALHWHPLFWTVPFCFGLFFYDRFGGWGKGFRTDVIWASILGAFILVYVIRMVLFFPSVMPLEYNSKAVIPKAVSFFVK